MKKGVFIVSEFQRNSEHVHPMECEAFHRTSPGNRKAIPQGKIVARPSGRAYFISGTDTGVGKTVATCVLGMLFQRQGWDVGVMKPVQCGGDDAAFLRKSLSVKDPLDIINPYRAKAPLSPHIAFKKENITVNIKKIKDICRDLKTKHDILLVEGAGGLLVPIKNNYLVADLIRDLDLELIIVSRLNLGTINHTLLTINQARGAGIRIKGVLFNESHKTKHGIPEKTNPQVIRRLGKTSILGTIPYLNHFCSKEILKKCGTRIHYDF